jgi:hypothetical protein
LSRTPLTVLVALSCCCPAAALAQNRAQPGPIIDLTGEWAARVHEDAPYRGPGGFLGDYTGVPINAAARQMAESWDASVLSQPERSVQAWPAVYAMRGEGPNIRISEVHDPVTDVLIALEIVGIFGRSDRTIWLDGRPHPSAHAEHTWAGFSTGTFHDGELTVTTTHMKMGVIQKVGIYTSPESAMTEHFFRHGNVLTTVTYIEDPVYLEEPFIRTQTWELNPTQTIAPPVAWQAVDELAGKPVGWVPHYPLGTKHMEPADTYGIPFEATQGGAKTIYPEYQERIEQLLAQERARGGRK